MKDTSNAERRLFAAMAMQGVLSNAATLRQVTDHVGENADAYMKIIAGICINQADALILELDKE